MRVVSLGAIGKAGAERGLSSTAATQRIQELEAIVGAQLLHRTTRSVCLSVDGKVFLGHAQRILKNIEDAFADLQNDPACISGDLRVASSASFGRKYLAPYVAEFLDLYPKLSLQLHLSDSAFDIVDNGFDLAIRLGEPSPSTLKMRRIGDSARIMVAAPSYLASHGTPGSPADLRQHECLIRSDIRNWSTRGPDGTVSDVKVTSKFNTNLAEAVTEAAPSGMGVARKCRWEVVEHLEDGRLVEVLPDHTVLPEWGIFSLRPPSRMHVPRARAFSDFIANKFKEIEAIKPKAA